MGEAKRRGTFEERKAQSIVRQREEEARRAERRRQRELERIRRMSPQERKEAVLVGGGMPSLGLVAAMAMASTAVHRGDRVLMLDEDRMRDAVPSTANKESKC